MITWTGGDFDEEVAVVAAVSGGGIGGNVVTWSGGDCEEDLVVEVVVLAVSGESIVVSNPNPNPNP